MGNELYRVALCLAVLLGLPVAPAPGMDLLEQTAAMLRENGISFDQAPAEKAAVAAFLGAVDPGARIVSAEEALALEARIRETEAVSPIELAETWPNSLRYLKVRAFNARSAAEVVRQLCAWQSEGAFGAVLDIRGAHGRAFGSVHDIVSACSGDAKSFFTVGGGAPCETGARPLEEGTNVWPSPIVLLVDGDTVGVAELFAGVMAGRGGTLLIGTRTRGDPRVRDMFPLPDGRVLLIAARRAVFPDGTECAAQGVRPDIAVPVEQSGAVEEASVEPAVAGDVVAGDAKPVDLARRTRDDQALARAVDILLGLQALSADEDRNESESVSP